jgi:hypothetical protein
MTGLTDGPTRWLQLTYASADSADASAPGGWRVQAASADLGAADQDVLVRGVTARLADMKVISNFPSDAELAARSRRLAYRAIDAGRVALWHAVTAGVDATGRPGNVFTHAALAMPGAEHFRPIELWRSPDWLVPFGPQEVSAASLPQSLRPGEHVTRGATIEFLLEGEHPGFDSLLWLLDGVARSTNTGRTLLCLVEDAEEATQWVAAVSYLTSGRLGLAVSWVTFERADTLAHTLETRPNLVFVPRVDETRLPPDLPDADIVDLSWELDGPANGAWHLPSGLSFPTTRWHARALDLFSLPADMAARVLEQLDDYQGAGAALHWPLSMALLCEPEAAFAHRLQLIEEVLGETPAAARSHPDVVRLIGELEAAQLAVPAPPGGNPEQADSSPATPGAPAAASSRRPPATAPPASPPPRRQEFHSPEVRGMRPLQVPPVPIDIPGLNIVDPPPPSFDGATPGVAPAVANVAQAPGAPVAASIEQRMFALYADVAGSREALTTVARCTAIAAGYSGPAQIPEGAVQASSFLAAAALVGLSVDPTPARLQSNSGLIGAAWRRVVEDPAMSEILALVAPVVAMTAALEEAYLDPAERCIVGKSVASQVRQDPDLYVTALANLARKLSISERARLVTVACRSVAIASNVPRSVFVIDIEDTTFGEGFAFECCAAMPPEARTILDNQVRLNLASADEHVRAMTSAVWSAVLSDVLTPFSARQAPKRKG